MVADTETIREALRCGQPRCACQRLRGQVHCPAHDDAHPSLSITERNGHTLVHCFASCTQEAVIEALRARGLWRAGAPPVPRPKGILADVVRMIERYVVLPSDHAVVVVALWILHTWGLAAFEVTPYLIIRSAEKRSGKTRLLEVLELLTPHPWRVVQPSEAVLFRKITKDCPVLLQDEADAIFNGRGEQYEPLRAALNAGFRRGVVVPRCVGEGTKQKLVDFETFCAKALAGIGDFPDTIEDRGVVIRLDRATASEQRKIQRLRLREAQAEAAPIRKQLAEWAERALPALRDARPAIPQELDGRAADAWEPLLAVAEQAGDGWSVLAWGAALALSTGAAREDDSLRVRLLADIRRVFDARGTARLTTADLIDGLCDDEAAPWGDWFGKRIVPQGLARLLRPFGIRPIVIRTGQVTPRGYRREDFEDAWARYLPVSPPLPDSNPQHPQQANTDAGFGPISYPQQTPPVAGEENGENSLQVRLVAGVADNTPPEGQAGGDEPMFTPEDLKKGGGIGQALARLGQAFGWGLGPYAPGRSVAPGKVGWLTFIRGNPVEELHRAFEGLAAVLDDRARGVDDVPQ